MNNGLKLILLKNLDFTTSFWNICSFWLEKLCQGQKNSEANRFFPVWENFTWKTLFSPCDDPVRDCSVFSPKRFEKVPIFTFI